MTLSVAPERDTPGAVLGMLEPRVTIGTAGALIGLAAVAWALNVQQALEMSDMQSRLGSASTGHHSGIRAAGSDRRHGQQRSSGRR